jgi:hypothetical protein
MKAPMGGRAEEILVSGDKPVRYLLTALVAPPTGVSTVAGAGHIRHSIAESSPLRV